jgi:hypothetical protein
MSNRFCLAREIVLALVTLGIWSSVAAIGLSADPNDPVPAPTNLTDAVALDEQRDLTTRIAEIQQQIDEFRALKELDLLTPTEERQLENLRAELEEFQSQNDNDQEDQDDQVQPLPMPPNPGSVWVNGRIAYRSWSSPTGYRAVEPTVMVWRRADNPWQRVTTVSDWSGRFQLRLRAGDYRVDLYLRPWWRPFEDLPVTVERGMREPYLVVSSMRTLRR